MIAGETDNPRINGQITTGNAHYPGFPNQAQSEGTIGLNYNLLGDAHFGAVNWDRN